MIFDEHVQSLYIKILRVQNILNKNPSLRRRIFRHIPYYMDILLMLKFITYKL